METIAFNNKAHTSREIGHVANRSSADQTMQTTPKERLHSVEEFVEKLEQAVLERL